MLRKILPAAILLAVVVVFGVAFAHLTGNPSFQPTLDDYSTATFDGLLMNGYSFEEATDIFEAELFKLIAQWRLDNGLPPLAFDEEFAGTSRREAAALSDMIEDVNNGNATHLELHEYATASRLAFAEDARSWVFGDINSFSTPASLAYDWTDCI